VIGDVVAPDLGREGIGSGKTEGWCTGCVPVINGESLAENRLFPLGAQRQRLARAIVEAENSGADEIRIDISCHKCL